MPKKEQMKIYTDKVKKNLTFPKTIENLENLPIKSLEDINFQEGDDLNSIAIPGGLRALKGLDTAGNAIKDLINDRLNTQTTQILGDFTFGVMGAIKIISDENNGVWISPAGILGKKAGNTTFALTNTGDATFSGTITASSIIGGTIIGSLFQTATSGKRIRMSSSPQNRIEFLKDDDVYGWLEVEEDGDVGYLSLGGDGGTIEIGVVLGAAATQYVSMPFINAFGKASFGQVKLEGSPNYPRKVGLEWTGGGEAYWSFDLEGATLTRIDSHLYPFTSGSYDLGSSTYRWLNLYLLGYLYGGVTTTNTCFLGNTYTYNVIPRANNSYNLGSSTYSFNYLYITRIARNISVQSLTPVSHNTYNLGTSSNRFARIYGVRIYCSQQVAAQHITGGDYFFKDKDKIVFSISETGGRELKFLNKKKEVIMKLSQNGDLFIKGQIKKIN